MNENENAVELNLTESVQDDAEQVQGESLSELLNDAAGTETENTETPPAKEPGWIKGRINKAVEKAIAETEARITKQYEDMLAPIRASVLERQAQELVESGEFKSLEIAKEYLALKGGMPAQTQQKTAEGGQQRDEQGRFVSRTEQPREDPAIAARSDLLAKQAKKIKANYGYDVMAEFNSNSDVKEKILSGEWDFYDVVNEMSERRTPSAPVRSPNRGQYGGVDIMSMTDAQFAKLNENLAAGRKYDVR